MHGLDVFRVVISPGSSHSFRVSVIRYDIAAIVKFIVTDGALPGLFDDLSVEQFPHLCWRTELAISPGVVWIFDALDTKLKSTSISRLLATAAEQRTMDWAEFIPTELHGISPEWRSMGYAGYGPMRGSTSAS